MIKNVRRREPLFPLPGLQERLGRGEERGEDDDLRGTRQDQQSPEDGERNEPRPGWGSLLRRRRIHGIQARAAIWL